MTVPVEELAPIKLLSFQVNKSSVRFVAGGLLFFDGLYHLVDGLGIFKLGLDALYSLSSIDPYSICIGVLFMYIGYLVMRYCSEE